MFKNRVLLTFTFLLVFPGLAAAAEMNETQTLDKLDSQIRVMERQLSLSKMEAQIKELKDKMNKPDAAALVLERERNKVPPLQAMAPQALPSNDEYPVIRSIFEEAGGNLRAELIYDDGSRAIVKKNDTVAGGKIKDISIYSVVLKIRSKDIILRFAEVEGNSLAVGGLDAQNH